MKNAQYPLFHYLQYGTIFLLFIAGLPAYLPAQTGDNWSHWSIVDDLVETWSLGITVSPIGDVWVNHSEDGLVSVLDGYHIEHKQCPQGIDKIRFSPAGDMWAVSSRMLHYLYGKDWTAYPLPFDTDETVLFYPVSNEHAVILFENTIYLFSRSNEVFQPIKTAGETGLNGFSDMADAPNNGFWVTGPNGVAYFQIVENTLQNWNEILAETLEFSNFQSPWVSVNNELFVIAQSKSNPVHLALKFNGEQWISLYSSNALNLVRCWKGLDNTSWVLNRNNTLIQVRGSTIDRNTSMRSHFGQILDYAIQQDGIFWLATSKGVFRYAPPVWRTPVDVQDIQRSVNAIVQDREGRLWFDCTRFLLKLEDGKWTRYPYPENKQSSFYETGTLCILPNQTIAVRMLNAEAILTVFNPTTEQFETLTNPYGLLFGAMTDMDDGAIWFQLGQNFGDLNKMSYMIASYNGQSFTPIFDHSNQWGVTYPRSILQEKEGGFWIGGTSGLGRYSNGNYELTNIKDQIDDEAAFALFRFQDHVIWAGGRNSIRAYDGEKWIVLLTKTDQIRSFYASKDGTVWVCTAAGLIRYFHESWITMTEKDGLPSIVVNEVFMDDQGQFWAATSNGIALHKPEMDIYAPVAELDEKENVSVFAPDSTVHLRMNGVDKWKSTNESNLYYSYRINNQTWSPFTSNPVASFETLSPGFYQFHFKVMDSNFNMSLVSEPFTFEVLLNWYDEPLVNGLIIIAIGITLFFMIYAVKHQIRLQFINSQLQKANEELERISCIDGLTGISNRRCFDEHLNTEWRRGLRTNTPISLIICDVDYFKLYNDHFGHLAGDDCLRVIAKTISSTILRAGDMVARYGGEEFVIVLVNTTLEGAQQVTDIIHEKIEDLCLLHPKSKCSSFVTISSGIASAVPNDKYNEKMLLAAADKALYLSKSRGRNRSSAIDSPFHDIWTNGSSI